MRTWRLLDPQAITSAENMALDEVLLELRGQGKGRNTLRFLQFEPRTALVGFHQSIQEELNIPYCLEHGIDVNRRITGGGALLFDESQIGWEIVCEKAFFEAHLPTDALFRRLCEPVAAALRSMGVDAHFRPRNDIEVAGRKISGTGGTDSEDAFLFQGTLLTDFDVETMLSCLRVPLEKLKAREIESMRERVTCLAWEMGCIPSGEEVKEALARSFEEYFDIRLEAGGLTQEEEALLGERLPHFRSQAWIDMMRPEHERSEAVRAEYKSPAGLIRMTLVVNAAKKILKQIYITGDFLAFPSRALFDLEAALRGKPLKPEALKGIVEDFFASGKIVIHGMGAEDMCRPLSDALNRIAP